MRRRVFIVVLTLVSVAGCGGGRAAVQPDRAGAVASPDRVPVVSPERAKSLGLTRRLPQKYARVCEKQAGYSPEGARACPPLIPNGRLTVVTAAPFAKQKRYSGGNSANLASRSLYRLGGRDIETNGGHWRYDVVWTPTVRRLVVDVGVQRPSRADERSRCRRSRLGRERVEVCRVVAYEKGGGLNGGHIAYVWDHDATTYVLSVHGYANAPRARAMTTALIAQVLG